MTFERIIGHQRQKEILRRAVRSGRLAHAYLFEGPDGIGKRLMALALVRSIFCTDGAGCGDCAACRRVDHGNHPDLHLYEPDGSTIKIEQIRELQRELALRPLEAPKKVCLIDHAEVMNPAAANALLKTLEEPTGESLLVLLTARPESLLPTVRSRCQRLPFGHLPQEELEKALVRQLGVDAVEGHILASLAEGSFRKALGKNRELYLEGRRVLLKRVTALSPGSALPLFDLADELAGEKEELPEVLEIFQSFYRDLLLHLHGRPENDLVNRDLLEKIRRIAGQETTESVLNKLEAVNRAQFQLRRNANRQLLMEVLLLQLAA